MNKLQEVVAALERAQLLVERPYLHTWPEITGLTADSRKVERGMLYCAVHGSARDGHEFVAAARERGAAAALVEREQGVEMPQILVRDGRRAAAVAAEAWYDRPAAKLDLVGVTGTNGRTTLDRKSTRLNSSHQIISYAVFCLKKKNHQITILSKPDA